MNKKQINEVTLMLVAADQLKIGDVVARSSGQITNIEFCPIHDGDSKIWKIKNN